MPPFIPTPWGIALMIVGLVYVLKPDLFRRGLWKRTSVAQRLLSPTGYIRYMRGFGIVQIVIGSALVFLDLLHFFD
jgi:hypothetical protein